jgi:hypothetical protein
MELSYNTAPIIAVRIPADGSDAQLVSVNIKPRPHDDGNADFFDDVPDLTPWLGDAFKQRRVSDFYVKNDEDPSPQFPGFVRDNGTALHGKYVLYYTILPSLPINKTCTKYTGFDAPENRLFRRGDLFVVRYRGELGMEHEYVNALEHSEDHRGHQELHISVVRWKMWLRMMRSSTMRCRRR